MDLVDCPIEEFDEKWIKIHNYSSNSDGESGPDESKKEFDVLYERMKPPPFKIDSPMLKIIEIGSPENSCHNNKAVSYAAALKQNLEAVESTTARTTPLDVQQDGVRKLSKSQRKRRKRAMKKAAENKLTIDECNNVTKSEGEVDNECEENRKNVLGAHSTTMLFDYPGCSIESHSSTPNFIEVNNYYETLPGPQTHEENDISKGVCAVTTVKGQDEITSAASVKIKKKKTKKKKRKKILEKTENNADTGNNDLFDLNFSQLQARYPVFKILTHTFDHLHRRIMKNEQNMLNKQSFPCANSLINLCSQFQCNLLETDGRCICTLNYVSRIVEGFLIVLDATYKEILPEPQLKHVFCVCTVITVVAIYYDSFLHQHKEAVQQARTKEDIDISVALKNIFYDLDAIAFRHFLLENFEYKFVESENELASYASLKSSLVLLEYTRKIILDMIQRVEASSVDYPCQWSYKGMFVAYGQSPGLLFASILTNKKLPDLLSWFCTTDNEAQTDNVDESMKFVNEKNAVDDRDNSESCAGPMKSIDSTIDLQNNHAQLSLTRIEDFIENEKFNDGYDRNYDPNSWRHLIYLENGEENVNSIEYPLQVVTHSCDSKKIVIIFLFFIIIRFFPDLLPVLMYNIVICIIYIIHLSEILFFVILFVYFCSFFLLKI